MAQHIEVNDGTEASTEVVTVPADVTGEADDMDGALFSSVPLFLSEPYLAVS